MASEAIRRDLWERDGGLCGICGTAADPLRFHLDHIVPLARGGPTRADNLRVAHPRCNIRRGAAERRRVPSTTVYRTTTIALTEDLHERIKRVARAERRTTNNYITVALEDVVQRYEAEHPELREEGAGRDD